MRRKTYTIEEFKRCAVAADEILPGGRLDTYPDLLKKGLFRIDLSPAGFFVTARGHVGLIPINDRIAVEVTPRVPVRNLEAMLLYASKAQPLVLRFNEIAFRDSPLRPLSILDLFAEQLIGLCDLIRDEGVYREYVRRPHTSSSPRGRIDPCLTARVRARTSDPTWASWSAFDRSRDNGPNRVIRLAIKILREQYLQMRERKGASAFASKLARVDGIFSGVRLSTVAAVQREPLVLHPTRIPSARAKTRTAVELAKAIVAGRGIELRSVDGLIKFPTLLIDMSVVFEGFARSILQAEFRARGRFIVLDGNQGGELGGREKFFSAVSPGVADANRSASPDLVIRESSGRYLIVGDVKYRPYDGSPERDDLNQVLAYSIVYGCKDVLLVYPARTLGTGQFMQYGTVQSVAVHVLVLDLGKEHVIDAVRSQATDLHALCIAKFPESPRLQLVQ